MVQDRQSNKSRKKKSTSVAASPLNGLKLDALLWFCGASILLLTLENFKVSNLFQFIILLVFGIVAVISIIFRAKRIILKIKHQNSERVTK